MVDSPVNVILSTLPEVQYRAVLIAITCILYALFEPSSLNEHSCGELVGQVGLEVTTPVYDDERL